MSSRIIKRLCVSKKNMQKKEAKILAYYGMVKSKENEKEKAVIFNFFCRRPSYTDSPNREESRSLRDSTIEHLPIHDVSTLATTPSSAQTELFHCPNSAKNVSLCNSERWHNIEI